MATSTIAPPAGFELDSPQSTGPQANNQTQTGTITPPAGFELDQPTTEGEQVNDVGNKVIVPKEGESFADTMKRAADYGKTVTQPQIAAEIATAPKKVGTVLAAAPAIGIAGPTALAGAGEAGAAIAEAVPNVLPHTIDGVKAIGTWAKANPMSAYILYNVIKDLIPGAKRAIGLVKAALDPD